MSGRLLVLCGLATAALGVVLILYTGPTPPLKYQPLTLNAPTRVWLEAGQHELLWRLPAKTNGPGGSDFDDVQVKGPSGESIRAEAIRVGSITMEGNINFIPEFRFNAPVPGTYEILVVADFRPPPPPGPSLNWSAGELVVSGLPVAPPFPYRAWGTMLLCVGTFVAIMGGVIAKVRRVHRASSVSSSKANPPAGGSSAV